ncbi:kinase-like domain-containing protein [Glomus cerebriforme]|uniref:Kinase-like domain-containing protein n=1 Tax=Glomus cerebriforme TaxID=658196 RepID=A0A397S7N5_9GLOM|nr:kinase-like domain-containing protein [Glomus cerebriforme]
MDVDLCFVLDCTGSMKPHIAAAKDCILQVSNKCKLLNPNIKLRIGFCGYRDHQNGSDRLQIFDFTDQYEEFKKYLQGVSAIYNEDYPEDVFGGLNAAITRLNWRNGTRILFHIGDYPPHGSQFHDFRDDYPNGDPYGLTAESVLEKMQSENILYFFGKITHFTEKMLQKFRSIIGEFPTFDLVGDDPIKLIDKFFKSASSSITMAVSLTSSIGSGSKDIYDLQRKKLEMDLNEPDWNKLPLQTGVIMRYILPKNLVELKDLKYFNKSNLVSESFSFKIATKPFSAGTERCAYYAINTKKSPIEKMVMKEYHRIGKGNPFEKYLEAVEISIVSYFLSIKFNSIAERNKIHKVNFINAKLIRTGTVGPNTQYYTIEPKLQDAEYKRFNSNSGVIVEFHPTLEAFAHYTYQYTKGYLVVYDLQGIELTDQYVLTDPAIHCVDALRFGRTNFGERGIKQCFLENHKCNDVCKKLKLKNIDTINKGQKCNIL